MLSFMELSAVLLTLCAIFGWLNRKYFPMPHTIGLLVMSVVSSLCLVIIDATFPQQHLFEPLTNALLRVDFSTVVMDGMLAFLLFAGALHVDVSSLKDRAIPVAILATLGTVLSTAVIGATFWLATQFVDYPVSLAWSLVFGALISPTDPVAVLSTLKNVSVPKSLESEMQGEALFNDGVGIVIFTILVRIAAQGNEAGTSALGISQLLLLEAGGGILLGLVTGYLAYKAMFLIDDYAVEVLISLALVTGTYALASRFHMSGPLSVVAAGLLIGDRAPRYALSDTTQKYLFALWTLIDEILNSILFLLIGLEVLIIRFDPKAAMLAAMAIPMVLLGRVAAVSAPPLLFAWTKLMSARNIPFLTWAGVRGGISVALALSVPDSPAKPAILAATYAVVLFSIIVQGSTLGYVARRTVHATEPETIKTHESRED